MTYRDAVREFKETYRDLYDNAVDYWTAEQVWAMFTDRLCKNGVITQRQYDTWQTPFKYGKHLKVRKI